MAIGDNFNAYTDGQPLDSESADWDVWLAGGSGVMTLDQHDDHSDLTLVVDMSNTGDNWAIYQIQVGSADHFAEVDVFLDSLDGANNLLTAVSGPVVRGNQSSMGSGTFDGYAAFLERHDNGVPAATVILRIYRIDDDVPTLLASSVDVAGEIYDASTTTATIRLEIEGTSLTAYSDGNELVSATDATHSAGQFCGVRLNRVQSATNGQPFFDNFAGDVLAGGATELDGTDTTQAQIATAATLTQTHELTVDSATQAQSATAAALTQVHELQPTSAVQGQTATAAALAQIHELAATDAVQAQTADAATVTEGVALSPASTLQGQEAATAALTQIHELTAADVLQAQSADTAVLTQLHELVSASAVQSQVVALPTITIGKIPEPAPIVLPPFRERSVPDFQESAVSAYRETSTPAHRETA